MSISGIGNSGSLYQSLLSLYQSQANSNAYTPMEAADSDEEQPVEGTNASGASKQQDAQALLRQLQMSSLSLVNFMNGDDSGSESDDGSLLGSNDETSGLTSLLSSSSSSDSNDPFALLLRSLGGQASGADLASLLEQAYSRTSAYEDADDSTPGQTVNQVN
ncbi:hypothetical protein GXP70_05185 [Paenibacillus lycopersici]|uniref:Uncharacterized protein n=1 Tax=Paenibacillus lycopersici TaxID=2704462 RepID=A0A6C0FVI2_9BACL|nr:hypothetical protein [Paenibacillus lycopersici]QHT59423.1 hypothetical protein GXP70_05185 [Paenibacillus lycopersici]